MTTISGTHGTLATSQLVARREAASFLRGKRSVVILRNLARHEVVAPKGHAECLRLDHLFLWIMLGCRSLRNGRTRKGPKFRAWLSDTD